MKILVLSWRDPRHPLAGGAEQVIHEHIKGWISKGHGVTLFSSKFKSSRDEDLIDGVQIIRGGYQYLGVQVAAFFYYKKNRENIDIVVDQFHGLPFFTPLYVDKPKLAVIQETAREVWFLNPLPWPLNWIVGIAGYLLEPIIFLFYKNVQFMTGSESAKTDVAKFGIPIKNITVVPHGVLIKQPKPFPLKEKIKTIVFLGVLSKDKGIEDALKCFAILREEGDFQFWVIGKPETADYYKKVLSLTQDLGLGNKLKFWGFVSQEKKFDLLARSHILVNPSIREGWGLVNIEANAMETPVIAYRSQGLVDSVKNRESGILVSQNTPEALSQAILDLFNDTNEYNKLKNGAVKWSKKFSWDVSINQSLRLIEKVKKS